MHNGFTVGLGNSPSWFQAVFFSIVFASVLYVHKAEESSMSRPKAHQANRCTFWTSWPGVSRKYLFMWILRNFGYSWLTEMRILVGRILHTGAEITLKIWYVGCHWFSFCQGYMVNKRRHYSAGGIRVDTTVHQTDLCTFWTSQTLFLVQNAWNAWIWEQFNHLAALLIFKTSIHRALNNTETMLFRVCFAFTMCIHTELEYCMT